MCMRNWLGGRASRRHRFPSDYSEEVNKELLHGAPGGWGETSRRLWTFTSVNISGGLFPACGCSLSLILSLSYTF